MFPVQRLRLLYCLAITMLLVHYLTPPCSTDALYFAANTSTCTSVLPVQLYGVDSPAALRVQCLLGVAAGRGLGTWHAAEPLLLSAHTLLCERYGSTAHGEVLLVAAAYGAVMAEHGRCAVETLGTLEGTTCDGAGPAACI